MLKKTRYARLFINTPCEKKNVYCVIHYNTEQEFSQIVSKLANEMTDKAMYKVISLYEMGELTGDRQKLIDATTVDMYRISPHKFIKALNDKCTYCIFADPRFIKD